MLEYQTTGRVRPAAASTIADEALAIERSWWRGPLAFDDIPPGKPAELVGATKLFYAHGVPDEDDLFMAFTDAAFILERLAEWAERFKLKWSVKMNGEVWGTIDPGGPGRPLLDEMNRWAGRVGVSRDVGGRWSVPERRRRETWDRWRDRK